MLLKEGISISKYNNKGFWVINTEEGRNLLVNSFTADLVHILQTTSRLEDAHQQFNSHFKLNVPFRQFENVILEKIGGYNILRHDKFEPKEDVKNKYLKLKIQLIPSRVAGILSFPFQHLFFPGIFWFLFISLSAFLLSVLISIPATGEGINYPLSIFLVGFTTLIHELGHIGACARFGLKHGGIGFGFYYIMPVMYADITNIWNTDKENRVIANLAGIFNELIYASLIVCIFFYTNDQTYLVSALFISTLLLWQLNPFVRFDGYWVVSDLTDTPNLLKKAGDELKGFFNARFLSNMLANNIPKMDRRSILLLMYGIMNFSVGIGFMAFTLFYYRNEIQNYPSLAYEFLNHVSYLDFSFQNINGRFLIVTLFYILFIRFLYKKIKAMLKKRLRNNSPTDLITTSADRQ